MAINRGLGAFNHALTAMDIKIFNHEESAVVSCPACGGDGRLHEINTKHGLTCRVYTVCKGARQVLETRVTTYEAVREDDK